jgi:putative resolvase
MKGRSNQSKIKQGSASTTLSLTNPRDLSVQSSATVESVAPSKKTTSLDKSNSCHSDTPTSEIIQDIGSGLNFKRKGLQAILVRFMRTAQLTIVIACRDI